MARKCFMEKMKKEPKFAVRKKNRCWRCGRTRAYYRRFGICRICLRELASRGDIAGLKKASW